MKITDGAKTFVEEVLKQNNVSGIRFVFNGMG